MLTREAILAAQDLKSEDVDVPEWGGSIRIRTMTGAERDKLLTGLTGADGKFQAHGYRTRLLACCIVDEGGHPLFSADELSGKNPLVTDRLFTIADRLNSIGEEAVEAAGKN